MRVTVILANMRDTSDRKAVGVDADGAIPASLTAERNNPGWISVSAEVVPAA